MTDTRTVDVFDATGAKAGKADLPGDVFDVTTNVPLIHQVVVAQLAAARQGTASTKTRGDVRGGGRKPYRQKGTGRARQGSTRAPQFAGGGAVHWRDGRFAPGYYALDLERAEQELDPGAIYRWSVLLIDRIDGEIVAEAWGLAERVAPVDTGDNPARAGLWYDAMAPFIGIDADGRTEITSPEDYETLATSAGVRP